MKTSYLVSLVVTTRVICTITYQILSIDHKQGYPNPSIIQNNETRTDGLQKNENTDQAYLDNILTSIPYKGDSSETLESQTISMQVPFGSKARQIPYDQKTTAVHPSDHPNNSSGHFPFGHESSPSLTPLKDFPDLLNNFTSCFLYLRKTSGQTISTKNTHEYVPHDFINISEFALSNLKNVSENSSIDLRNIPEHLTLGVRSKREQSFLGLKPSSLHSDLGNTTKYLPFQFRNSPKPLLHNTENSSQDSHSKRTPSSDRFPYNLENTSNSINPELQSTSEQISYRTGNSLASTNSRLNQLVKSISLVQTIDETSIVRGPPGTMDFEDSLQLLLEETDHNELSDCDKIIITDRPFFYSAVLVELLRSHNLKQILFIRNSKDFETELLWTSTRCQGVFILLSNPELLFKFGDESLALWDYDARVIIVGLTEQDLELFAQTKKAKRTEKIIGIVKGGKEGRLKIFMNELYWGKRGIVKIGDWRGHFFSRTPVLFPDKISDLRRVVLNVTTFEYPPATIYRRSSDGSLLFKYGRDITVVRTLAQVFNFSVKFKEPGPGELWGRKQPNGSWDGIVGFLGRGEADIAVANIYLTALLGRSEFQEYSSPYTSDIGCVVSRKDQPLPRWQSPGLPFHPLTWAAIFVGLIISGPLLNVLGNASARIGKERASFQSLTTSCLYAYGVHFNHAMAKLPVRPSTKIFVAFLWLYAIILITAYSSNLIAFLTVSRDPPSIETFQELQGSRMRVLGIGSFFKSSMQQAGNKYLRALAERFFPHPTFEDGKDEVLSGKAVMMDSRSVLEYYSAQITTSRGRPLLRIMKECFSPYNIGIAYQRNSPLKSKFDKTITAMFESGLVRRWFLDSIELNRKFQIQDRKTMGESISERDALQDDNGVIPLGTEHLQGVFIVYGFGILFSIAVFMLECTTC